MPPPSRPGPDGPATREIRNGCPARPALGWRARSCGRKPRIPRRRAILDQGHSGSREDKTMPQFTTENVCYLKHGSREIMARVFKPEGAGPFPCYIDLHGGAWNNGDLEDRTGLGEYLAHARRRHAHAEFPPRPGRLSDHPRRHPLRHSLGQGAREGAEDQPGSGHDRRRVERRSSGDAGRDAAERSALYRDPGSGRGRRQRQGGHHAVAGHQPAVALSPCEAAGRRRQSAGLGGRHGQEARDLLARRSDNGRRQPDAAPGARARRSQCRRRSGSRAART